MDFLCKSNFEYKIKFILGYEIILYIRNHSDGNLRRLLLEKPRDFDPFGQTGLSPLATI